MNHFILIGMRGAGKSFLGKKLAQKLRLPFLDTDTLIEKQEEENIAQIVEKKGWDYFREKEHELIYSFSALPQSVISTGGGMPVFQRNASLLTELGDIIWVRADEKVMLQRVLRSSSDHRPVLTKEKTLQEEFASLYEERKPLYKKLAQYTLDSLDSDPLLEEKLDELIHSLQKKRKKNKKSLAFS